VTVDRVRALMQTGPGWVSHVLQEAFVELLRGPRVGAREPGRSYAARRDALIAPQAEHGLQARGPTGRHARAAVPAEAAPTALPRRGGAPRPPLPGAARPAPAGPRRGPGRRGPAGAGPRRGRLGPPAGPGGLARRSASTLTLSLPRPASGRRHRQDQRGDRRA